MASNDLPRAPHFDSSLAFLREGYTFIPRTCDALRSEIFACRLMLREAVCISGPKAARAFYTPGRFTRRGGLPMTTVSLLQDYRSVMLLDGAGHHRRKHLFLSLLTPESVSRAGAIFSAEWQRRFDRPGSFVLLDTASHILCRTALIWCGLDPDRHDAMRRTREFAAMVAGSGRIGFDQVKGQLARRRNERWARGVIRDLRQRQNHTPNSPALAVALARDANGRLLPEKTAAVELINLLRPTVAVARYIAFAAHALHLNGEWRERLRGSTERRAFAEEVRRFYPFIPAMGGRVLEPFAYGAHMFRKGDWVLLDLYGTNRHASWGDPDRFRPDRFIGQPDAERSIVSHGAGDRSETHRCPGEDLTVALVAIASGLLAAMRYAVPNQNLMIPLNRIPTAPNSGFVMRTT